MNDDVPEGLGVGGQSSEGHIDIASGDDCGLVLVGPSVVVLVNSGQDISVGEISAIVCLIGGSLNVDGSVDIAADVNGDGGSGA